MRMSPSATGGRASRYISTDCTVCDRPTKQPTTSRVMSVIGFSDWRMGADGLSHQICTENHGPEHPKYSLAYLYHPSRLHLRHIPVGSITNISRLPPSLVSSNHALFAGQGSSVGLMRRGCFWSSFHACTPFRGSTLSWNVYITLTRLRSVVVSYTVLGISDPLSHDACPFTRALRLMRGHNPLPA
jgi:hypothetical protein